MINDLFWNLLSKLGVQKEGVITVGKPKEPLSTPSTEGYKVPEVKGAYTAPTPKSTVSQYQPKIGRSQQQVPEQAFNPISQASNKFNVPLDLLLDIALSESSYNPKNVNEIGAQGLYQFTPQTWQEVLGYARNPDMSLYGQLPNEDPLDPLTNAIAAAYLIKMGQLGKWDASEHNWGQYYQPQELEDQGFYKQSLYHKPGIRPSVRLGGGQ